MDILLLQTNIKWESPEYNRTRASEIINNFPVADIIVLPEMFTTGFVMSPENIADKESSETLAWMQKVAKNKNAAIAASMVTKQENKYYNRLYFVKPDGSYTTYDKRHLFSFGEEDKKYTAGKNRIIVEHKGVRILLQICYDLRFPVFSRNNNDYDMIIYVANWPTQRVETWNTLLQARAIENQCYIAAVNRTGNDPVTTYCGGTHLLDYFGKPIVSAKYNEENAVLGTINIQKLNDFRQKFPALKDADNFTIDI